MTPRIRIRPLAALLLSAAPLAAQAGDREGEAQPDLPPELVVPRAPALSWRDELATFRVAEGFRVELVAAEPLVNDPVAAEFDERGRLWVVEMRGYMPDVDGRDEDAPVGAIAVLEDRDDDGVMDARRTFLDGLVLPRSVHPCLDGALVILPGEVLFCRDRDGDGRADERERIDTYRGGIDSPEHALNGFVRTLDNWYRCANGPVRYRRLEGRWVKGATAGGGQWGITQDDLGRVFYNTNPHPLRGDLFPSVYSLRNPNLGPIAGTNVLLSPDLETWPARITPGVNRGYQEGTLRADHTLRVFTAACGPHVLRGTALGEEARGDAFVPEPSGNLVKRFHLRERGLEVVAENVYAGREFWSSTDERFRPVNAFGGPDGALYVVDMYRGIIQHRVFVTSFLRKQILARGLDRPLGLGRIWRVVSEGFARPSTPRMHEWSWDRLVDALSAPDGWTRDAAQRVIVEEWDGDRAALLRLRELALRGAEPLGRLHALWTLEGIDGWTRALCLAALDDPDPRVACAALRVAEPYLSTGREEILAALAALAGRTSDPRVRHQCVLSLGAARTDEGDAVLADLLEEHCADPYTRTAALSGLARRELAFLETLLGRAAWADEAPGRAELLALLARTVVREGRGDRLARLVGLAASEVHAWRARALVRGLLDGRSKGPDGLRRPIRLSEAPRTLGNSGLGDLARALDEGLVWPGKPGVADEAPIRPLDPTESASFERGREIYSAVCAACHQPSGLGEAGKAPPLRGSPWVLGPEERLLRIVAQGLSGPIEIDGETWDLEMPAWSGSDEELAALLTYLRREWGHGAEPIARDRVRALRAAASPRAGPWTAEELLAR